MKLRYLTYILMPVAIIMAFLWAPAAAGLSEASRILYFHVPLAWLSVLAFAVSGIISVRMLVSDTNGKEPESRAALSAEIGIFFTTLTIITGSVWAKISWGSYWNWDPRETSIVILFLIYIAYFTLRWRLAGIESRDRISAIYLIMAAVTVPFFVFIVPRIYPSLHPDPIINSQKKIHMDIRMIETLCVSILAFSVLYLYLLNLLTRISRAGAIIREKDDLS